MLQGRGALQTCTSCQASVTLQHILLAISLLLGHCPLTHVTTVLSFHATNYILTYHINSINFIAMSPSLHVTHHKNITASHPSFLWIFFCTKNNCFYFLKYSNKILTRFNECRASLCLESNPILFFLVAQDSINYKCIFS